MSFDVHPIITGLNFFLWRYKLTFWRFQLSSNDINHFEIICFQKWKSLFELHTVLLFLSTCHPVALRTGTISFLMNYRLNSFYVLSDASSIFLNGHRVSVVINVCYLILLLSVLEVLLTTIPMVL